MEQRCAGGIVLGDSGTIALVRNRTKGGWFFPKGKQDAGEDDETTARREIEEETSLTRLEYLDDLGIYTRPNILPEGGYGDQVKHIHMFLFAAPMHATIAGAHEIEEAAWVALPRVLDMLGDEKDKAWFVSVFERVRQGIQRD
jgi:8-oxo-dGTP pyrophosphatase MutT (NUDIX family)